jgi:probable rRNA maturation factor
MIEVQISDERGLLEDHEKRLLSDLVQTVAQVLKLKQGEVSIVLVNNDEIQALNRQYRSKDQPTDVLSFPMTDGLDEVDEDDYLMLGDVVISVPKAREQAKEYGHSFERELGFLLVHGLLHLAGFTHDQEDDAKRMFSLQEEILSAHQLLR